VPSQTGHLVLSTLQLEANGSDERFDDVAMPIATPGEEAHVEDASAPRRRRRSRISSSPASATPTQSSLDERAAEHGGSAFHLFLTIDLHLFFTIDHSSMWRQRRP
jgi:hypothetical protein